MSRGPGRWQRAILEALQTQERFFLVEILPLEAIFERTRSSQRAAIRAAHRLAQHGLITLNTQPYGWQRWHYTGERLVRLNGLLIARPGAVLDRWAVLDAYAQAVMCAHLDEGAD
jgi:hypothetical protein